ncbi:MAG: hypothetical protein IPF66_16515 [Holophagales bacterium]|nr:hypothetical protein [Holophagales bacterium]
MRADADTPVTKTDVAREEIEKKNMGQEMPHLLKDLPAMTYYSDTGLATATRTSPCAASGRPASTSRSTALP